jgi:hypothetical protein
MIMIVVTGTWKSGNPAWIAILIVTGFTAVKPTTIGRSLPKRAKVVSVVTGMTGTTIPTTIITATGADLSHIPEVDENKNGPPW